MRDFYGEDVYWLVTVDGLISGLFMLGDDAKEFYAKKAKNEHPEAEVALWRLNGGYLCTPAVEKREAMEVEG